LGNDDIWIPHVEFGLIYIFVFTQSVP